MIYFLLTFDVPNSLETAPKSVGAIADLLSHCYRLLDRLKCRNATWFLDEYDYRLTSHLPREIGRMAEYGEIALHSHLNKPPHGAANRIPGDYQFIFPKIQEGYERLGNFLVANRMQSRLNAIRSGSFLTNIAFFKVVLDLGLRIDSSIPSYHSFKSMTLKQLVAKYLLSKLRTARDQRRYLPSGSQPYYFHINQSHKKRNQGDLLEVPVNIFTRMLEQGFNLADLVKIQLERNRGKEWIFLNFCLHPFEFPKFDQIANYIHHLTEREPCLYVTTQEIAALIQSSESLKA